MLGGRFVRRAHHGPGLVGQFRQRSTGGLGTSRTRGNGATASDVMRRLGVSSLTAGALASYARLGLRSAAALSLWHVPR